MDKSEYTKSIKEKLDHSYWDFLRALEKYREISSFPLEKLETSAKYRRSQKKCFPSLKEFSFVKPSSFKPKWFMTLEPSFEWRSEGREKGYVMDGYPPLLNDMYTFAVKAPPTANFAESDIMINPDIAMNYKGKDGNFYVLESGERYKQYKRMLLFLQIFNLYLVVLCTYGNGTNDLRKGNSNFDKFFRIRLKYSDFNHFDTFFRLCLKYQEKNTAYNYLTYSICPLIENIRRLYTLQDGQNKSFFSKNLNDIPDEHQKILWQIAKLRDEHFAHNNSYCARNEENCKNIPSLLKHNDTDEVFLKELISLKIVPPQKQRRIVNSKTLNNELIFSHLMDEAQHLLDIKNQKEYISNANKKYLSPTYDYLVIFDGKSARCRSFDDCVAEAINKIQHFQETLKEYGIKRKGLERILKDYGLPKEEVEYYIKSPLFWRCESLHGNLTAKEIMNMNALTEKINVTSAAKAYMAPAALDHIRKIDTLIDIVNEYEKMRYLYPQLKKDDTAERNAVVEKILSTKQKYERMQILKDFHSQLDKNGIPRMTALKFKDIPLMAKKSTLKKLLSDSTQQTNESSQITDNLKIQKNTIKSH